MPENAYRRSHLHQHLARHNLPCPERAGLDQSTPPGLLPAQTGCVRCGRVTARRAPDGMPWCGGEPITAEQQWAEMNQPPAIRPVRRDS